MVHATESGVLHISAGPSLIVPTSGFESTPALQTPEGGLSFSPNGNSGSWWLAIGADKPIAQSLSVGGSIAYRPQPLAYFATERTVIATPTGGTQEATLEHDLSLQMYALSLEPYIRYEPIEWLGLRAGIPFSIPVTSKFLQTQRFIDPPGLTFVDGSTEQVVEEGSVTQSSSVVISVAVRAEGMFALNASRSLVLVPSVGGVFNLSSWVDSYTINNMSFEGGIGIRYAFTNEPEVIPKRRDTTYVRDTITILSSRIKEPVTERVSQEAKSTETTEAINVVITERYYLRIPKPPAVLKASIGLAFEGQDGSVTPEARLTVNKVKRTRIVPVLPVVVFDSDGGQMPQRYVKLEPSAAKKYAERAALVGSTHWQYSVMNIVGARMRNAPTSKITLVGFTDGTAAKDALAMQRGENLKHYLGAVFGINDKRIAIDVRRGKASQLNWIVLSDSTRKLIQPVEATDTISETLLPTVRIVPEVVTEIGVRSWIVRMSQNESVITTRNGNGDVPPVLKWDMNADVTPDKVFNNPVTIEMDVSDHEGGTVRTESGRITLLGPMATSAPQINVVRRQALSLRVTDMLLTPEMQSLSSAQSRTIYDSPLPNSYWQGLSQPELGLYNVSEAGLYTNEERRP